MINLKKQDPVADAVKDILQQEALKGNQHEIDKNKNNKIDAHDFKILRGEKKEVKKEEVENFEEGIGDVVNKFGSALKKGVKAVDRVVTGGDKEDLIKLTQKQAGVPQTGKKPVQKEEVEQIDELSKSTLGSYAKKASHDATISRKIGADFEHSANRSRNPGMKAAANSLADKYKSKSWKRKDGVNKAVDRLTKEDVEGVKLKTLSQFRENAFDWKKKPEPTPNGGSGVKQGSRYGGSKQKDKPEQESDSKK